GEPLASIRRLVSGAAMSGEFLLESATSAPVSARPCIPIGRTGGGNCRGTRRKSEPLGRFADRVRCAQSRCKYTALRRAGLGRRPGAEAPYRLPKGGRTRS